MDRMDKRTAHAQRKWQLRVGDKYSIKKWYAM